MKQKAEKLFDGITEVKDWLVEEAGSYRFRKRSRWPLRIALTAACLALVLTVSALLPGSGLPGTPYAPALAAYALSVAEYPEMVAYPGEDANGNQVDRWMDSLKSQWRDVDTTALQPYLKATVPQFLSDCDTQNVIFSPLNVYMALSMLAELTEGESRTQILSLLGSEDMAALRQQANDLWNLTYRDDGIFQRVLGAALWLNEDQTFHQDTLDTLAENYYASSFQGRMGDESFDEALRTWLDQQTGGMLGEQVDGLSLDPATVLALTTTVHFKAKWNHGFWEAKTAEGIFHGAAGDVACSMMQRSEDTFYYWSDNFTAVRMAFESGGMWYILPDEGVTPADLLEDADFLDLIADRNGWESKRALQVNMTVPRFDVSAQTDLKPGLEALGVTDVFDARKADFSPATEDADLYLSAALHGVRVKIDEEGCEAAAYTMLPAPGSAPPPGEEVDFVLDRPFLFCVTGESELPLFAGVVNQP